MVSIMNDEILNRFNLILGEESMAVNLEKLSSAQKARFISWLRENNFDIPKTTGGIVDGSKSTNESELIDEGTVNRENLIGIDIQFISELFPQKANDLKSDPELMQIFTRREIAFAETKHQPIETLSGIFAAKEAIIKLFQHNLNVTALNRIEVTHDEKGKPIFPGCSLSISHSRDYVIAVATKSIVTSQINNNKTTEIIDQSKNNLVHSFSKSTALSLIILTSLITSSFVCFVFWLIFFAY